MPQFDQSPRLVRQQRQERDRMEKMGKSATRRGTLQLLAALGLQGMAQGPSDVALATALPPDARANSRPQEQSDMAELTITHLNPEGMHANPAYSQAVSVSGSAKTIYVGGQNAVDADGKIVGVGDLVAQTEQALSNLETVLAAGGATKHDVVKWTMYVVQGQDLRAGFAAFQRKWGTLINPPAISMAFVAGLAHPDFLLEIEAIAVVPAEADGG